VISATAARVIKNNAVRMTDGGGNGGGSRLKVETLLGILGDLCCVILNHKT
jgi:hypothetical protein